jgi:hypothetical protein
MSRGLPQTEVWTWQRIATGLTWLWQPVCGTWQSAVHLRAVCQEVIPVVAIRGIWPRNLANDRIPVSAILHRQFPCLLRNKFLKHDFLGVRQIRGGLFRPKLYTNGLSWQTTSCTIPLIWALWVSEDAEFYVENTLIRWEFYTLWWKIYSGDANHIS